MRRPEAHASNAAPHAPASGRVESIHAINKLHIPHDGPTNLDRGTANQALMSAVVGLIPADGSRINARTVVAATSVTVLDAKRLLRHIRDHNKSTVSYDNGWYWIGHQGQHTAVPVRSAPAAPPAARRDPIPPCPQLTPKKISHPKPVPHAAKSWVPKPPEAIPKPHPRDAHYQQREEDDDVPRAIAEVLTPFELDNRIAAGSLGAEAERNRRRSRIVILGLGDTYTRLVEQVEMRLRATNGKNGKPSVGIDTFAVYKTGAMPPMLVDPNARIHQIQAADSSVRVLLEMASAARLGYRRCYIIGFASILEKGKDVIEPHFEAMPVFFINSVEQIHSIL